MANHRAGLAVPPQVNNLPHQGKVIGHTEASCLLKQMYGNSN